MLWQLQNIRFGVHNHENIKMSLKLLIVENEMSQAIEAQENRC